PGSEQWERHHWHTAPRTSATFCSRPNEQGILVRRPPNKDRTGGGAGLVARGRRPVLGPAHVHLGERLQALRRAAGLTMRDLRPVISQAHLSEVENGLVTPSSVLLGQLVAAIGGDPREFARLLVAVRTENEERRHANAKQRGERYVAGLANPLAVTSHFVLHGRPEIRVADQGGDRRVIEVQTASAARDLAFTMPVVVEEADDDYTVGPDRIISSSIFSRRIRATEPGVAAYRWWFTEAPTELVVRSVTLGVSAGGTISRVWQLGPTSYGVAIALSRTLARGESMRLRYYKVIEAIGYCSRWVRRVHAVDLETCRLAVRFDGVEPTHVWHWANLPASATPGLYSAGCELKRE